MPRTAKPDRALANAIRRMREERGLTREDVAFQSGVTVGSLARIELAQSAPAWGTVAQIARAMEVPLVELARQVEGLD
jgi:FXSXX-COOH protein